MHPTAQLPRRALALLRVALAALCLLLSSAELAARGKPPSGGGGSPPNPEIAISMRGRNKPTDVFLINADGSNATKVYTTTGRVGLVDINRVYNELLIEDHWGGSKLWLLQFDVSSTAVSVGTPHLIDGSSEYKYGADFSPDGEYMLFQTLDTSVTPAAHKVYLRSTEPTSGETPKLIYTGRGLIPGGVCWLLAAFPGSYKIAIHTTYPAGTSEAEILLFEIDPTKPANEVIPKDGSGEPAPYAVLSTSGKPFTIGAPIDSARTTESIVAVAFYRDERAPNTPKGMLIQASRAIQWFPNGTILELTQPFDQGVSPRNPRFSPDDTKLLYGKDGKTVIRNLSTGVETILSEGADAGDWAPAVPVIP